MSRPKLPAVEPLLLSKRRALPSQLVTVKEASRVLGVHEDTIRRRIADGTIPSRKLGKLVRVDLSDAARGPSDDEVARTASRAGSPIRPSASEASPEPDRVAFEALHERSQMRRARATTSRRGRDPESTGGPSR